MLDMTAMTPISVVGRLARPTHSVTTSRGDQQAMREYALAFNCRYQSAWIGASGAPTTVEGAEG
jgi:hypothetical protein